jgi:translocation and assembly module TamA
MNIFSSAPFFHRSQWGTSLYVCALRTFRLSLAGLYLALALALAGCAGQQTLLSPLDEAFDDNATEKAAEALLESDPGGPLPQPQLPPELAAAAGASGAAQHDPSPRAAHPEKDGDRESTPRVSYSVQCESPDAPELAETFLAGSTLVRMEATPLDSVAGLEQRLKASLIEGSAMLRSFGYYSGKVHGSLDRAGATRGNGAKTADAGQPALTGDGSAPQKAGSAKNQGASDMRVKVVFTPGPRYSVGKTAIIRVDHEIRAAMNLIEAASRKQAAPQGQGPASGPPEKVVHLSPQPTGDASQESPSGEGPSGAPTNVPVKAPDLPQSLEDVGLAAGSPAIADTVLSAVDRVRAAYRNRGYPQAVVISSRFFLDHENRLLDAEVRVLPGPFMRMGGLEIQQDSSVTLEYLQAKQTWEEGEAWNQDKVEAFRDALRQTGLFLTIDLNPSGEEDTSGNRPVLTALTAAPERTVGGAVKYDTSFGPGVQGYWEHRNLTGRGDSLRVELPIWADMQELTAKYRLPFFMRPDQDFIAQAAVLNQDLDAYELQAGRVALGIDRRLSRRWSVTVQGSAEAGSLKDPDKPRRDYVMFGLPLSANFDSTRSLLDATDGGRAAISLSPYTGKYDGDFNVLRSRIDLQRFIPLVGEDTLVLALRGAVGSLSGADADEVPPSVRFYSGGGGSVRGFEFQSLGPRNDNDDPLGGSALTEVSVEPRLRFSETWGMVAFLDGGMAYDDAGDLGTDLRWGAGVGLRVYTAIGPVRLDVATPLNPRDDDDPLQFYISIGQSF